MFLCSPLKAIVALNYFIAFAWQNKAPRGNNEGAVIIIIAPAGRFLIYAKTDPIHVFKTVSGTTEMYISTYINVRIC